MVELGAAIAEHDSLLDEIASDLTPQNHAAAVELAPHRIRVNAIAPGLTDTAQPRHGSTEEEIAASGRAIPLGRIAEPEEIARAAVFLASDAAGFITGQCMHVNGGGYLG